MNKTEVKILAIEVVKESDLLDQEKRELVNFIKETPEFSVIERVLESYDLLEKCGKDEDEEMEECLHPSEEDEEDEETKECHVHGLSLEDLDEFLPVSAAMAGMKKGEGEMEQQLPLPIKPKEKKMPPDYYVGEGDEDTEGASESAMGPLKTPRDQDLDKLKEEIDVPSVLDEKFFGRNWTRGGMKQSAVNFLKTQQGRPEIKIPSSTQYVKPGLRTRLSHSLVRVRPKTAVAVP